MGIPQTTFDILIPSLIYNTHASGETNVCEISAL
jgi:hypothetical protein